jgi:DNA-binding NarL/FixJ family response regulator
LEEPLATHILIVDDSPLVRQRVGDLLQQHPHWEVCGEAVDGADAVEKAQALRPDLIVLDFMMPGMNGLQAAREIGKLIPGVPILMFSMHVSRQFVEEARDAGCRGAVAKSDVGHVIEGVEALLHNEAYFPQN